MSTSSHLPDIGDIGADITKYFNFNHIHHAKHYIINAIAMKSIEGRQLAAIIEYCLNCKIIVGMCTIPVELASHITKLAMIKGMARFTLVL